MAEFFRVVEVRSATVVELAFPAHLDSGEFDRLNELLLDVFSRNPGGRWVLDLAALAYMGSSVLGLMVNLRQRVKDAGGKLAFCNCPPGCCTSSRPARSRGCLSSSPIGKRPSRLSNDSPCRAADHNTGEASVCGTFRRLLTIRTRGSCGIGGRPWQTVSTITES